MALIPAEPKRPACASTVAKSLLLAANLSVTAPVPVKVISSATPTGLAFKIAVALASVNTSVDARLTAILFPIPGEVSVTTATPLEASDDISLKLIALPVTIRAAPGGIARPKLAKAALPEAVKPPVASTCAPAICKPPNVIASLASACVTTTGLAVVPICKLVIPAALSAAIIEFPFSSTASKFDSALALGTLKVLAVKVAPLASSACALATLILRSETTVPALKVSALLSTPAA